MHEIMYLLQTIRRSPRGIADICALTSSTFNMRIAINGMGRIGRLLFRRLVSEPKITVVAVNDIMNIENLLYLVKYDSVYGRFDKNITLEKDFFSINDKDVRVLNEPDPLKLPWRDIGVDVVIECTGVLNSKTSLEAHLAAGAKKVLLSTTGPEDVPLLIYGHNHHKLEPSTNIFSVGGCMTNCATHLLYILNSIGIESVQMNILHSYTSRQEIVDTSHRQFRRGRAAAESVIPVEIDLAQSLERFIPLKGKMAAMSTRIPVKNGAMVDFTAQLASEVTVKDINILFEKAANNGYKNIIDYTEDPIVSSDITGDPHSCIVDGTLTSVIGKQVKLIAWFDNEYGYTSRIIDWLHYM
jgi:glyceraldehyde 3-phosphate dehydrogenase